MRPIYYIANSIYQFAYALPLYERLGGTFVVNSQKKLRQFKAFVAQRASPKTGDQSERIAVISLPRESTAQLKGVLFFLANSIQIDKDYSQSITVFHEHGTSDKLYEGGDPIAIRKLEKYNYILLSGPKNRQRLDEIGVNRKEDNFIPVGCLRFDKLLSGEFDRNSIEKDLGIFSTQRKTILYAPTWQFGQGTFKKYAHKLTLSTRSSYNLILRPHYHDRKYGYLLYSLTKLMGQKHVCYASPKDINRKDTFACFSASDLLISDISSVVYEYLIMERPILLIDNAFEKRHQMPPEMDIAKIATLHKRGDCLEHSVKNAIESFHPQAYRTLLENCFYQPNGGAVDRAVNFFIQVR